MKKIKNFLKRIMDWFYNIDALDWYIFFDFIGDLLD